MNNDEQPVETAEPPRGVGAQLRTARESKGLTLEQVAAQTRIPQRLLETIEAGDFGKLPGRTYAIGFSRTYAKTVGLDQDDVVAMVQAELDENGEKEERPRPATFEPGDPARVPSRGLGWFAVFALILFLVGAFFFFRAMFVPAGELPSLVEREEAQQAAAARQAAAGQEAQSPSAAAQPTGPVVFTATEEAWVRFYTPSGTVAEMLMAPGDSYTVPADAAGVMLRTGRPDALRITVGGRQVPRLAEEQRVISDVPVTAEALVQRQQPAPAPAPAPAGENRPAPTT